MHTLYFILALSPEYIPTLLRLLNMNNIPVKIYQRYNVSEL